MLTRLMVRAFIFHKGTGQLVTSLGPFVTSVVTTASFFAKATGF